LERYKEERARLQRRDKPERVPERAGTGVHLFGRQGSRHYEGRIGREQDFVLAAKETELADVAPVIDFDLEQCAVAPK
jgi:hypothetical protein